MILPSTLYFLINYYLPMAGLYFAFTDYRFNLGPFGSPFVGLRNFEYLFHSGILWRITRNTVLYNAAFIAVGTVVEVAFAVFVTEMTLNRYRKVAQQLVLLPHFVSFVIVGTIAYNMLSTKIGLIPAIVERLGGEMSSVYARPSAWPPIIVIARLWKSFGYGSVIYIAALAGINRELYEAADLDGATIWGKIRHIALPHIKPTFVILLLFALGRILQGQFELFWNLVGPNALLYEYTDIIETFVYRQLRVEFDLGLGSAAGMYKSVFGFVLIVTVNWLVKRSSNGELALF